MAKVESLTCAFDLRDPTTFGANPCDANHDCLEHGDDSVTGRTHCVKTDMHFVTNSPTPGPKFCLNLIP
jgi:hypothetical protein